MTEGKNKHSIPIISAIFNIAVFLSLVYKTVYPDSHNIFCELLIKIYSWILGCGLVALILLIFFVQLGSPIMAMWKDEPNKLKAFFYAVLMAIIYFGLLAFGAGDGVDIPYARYFAR